MKADQSGSQNHQNRRHADPESSNSWKVLANSLIKLRGYAQTKNVMIKVQMRKASA